MFDEMKKDLNEVETISLVPSKYYNISGLVPKNVIDYISDKGLY